MKCFYYIVLLFSYESFDFVDGCIATAPTQGPAVTDAPVTDAPVTDDPVTEEPLRRCSPDALNYGTGDNQTPQVDIDVNYSNYVSTQIGNTLETTNTMLISCTADQGLFANMIFDNGIAPVEGEAIPRPNTITVNASCGSVDMIWKYVVTFNGQLFEIPINGVTCQQTSF